MNEQRFSQIPTEAQVVVIGGGIVGTSSAYQLSKRGMNVILVERGSIGREQSSRNWGFVRQQGRHPIEVPLMMESNRMWQELERELDADVGWTRGGNLALASDEEDLSRFEEWSRVAEEHGLDTRIIARSDLAEIVSFMVGDFAGGMFTPSDGHADPDKVSKAYAAAAARNGAHIITDLAVECLLIRDGAIRGVHTEMGEIRSETVVCAAGAFTSRILRPIGVRLPQRIVRATVASTEPLPPISRAGVWADRLSFRQRRDGSVVFAAGASADYDLSLGTFRDLRQFLPNYWKNKGLFRFRVGSPLIHDLRSLPPWTDRARHPFSLRNGLEPRPNATRVDRGRREFERLFPSLGPVTVDRSWAGYVDATPDAIPVIEALDEPRGLVVAAGFSGHGFALGPITGRLVAELLVDGEASLDVYPMRLARFADGDLAEARSVL